MGLSFFEYYEPAAKIFDKADQLVGYSVSRLCFEGPPDELTKTVNSQVAIFLIDYIAANFLIDSGIMPAAVAGHSLGEYAAVTISGALGFEETLNLVRLRAEFMHQASLKKPGIMLAVIGLDEITVQDVLHTFPDYSVANYNCPGQIIISGSGAKIEKMEEAMKTAGATRLIKLKVSGAFHSSAMTEAEEKMAALLDATEFKPALIPVYSNITAEPTIPPEKIRENLAKQICGSVRWEQSVRAMIANGIDVFIEAGPGTILTGLIKRIDPNVSLYHLEEPDMKTIDELREILRQ